MIINIRHGYHFLLFATSLSIKVWMNCEQNVSQKKNKIRNKKKKKKQFPILNVRTDRPHFSIINYNRQWREHFHTKISFFLYKSRVKCMCMCPVKRQEERLALNSFVHYYIEYRACMALIKTPATPWLN